VACRATTFAAKRARRLSLVQVFTSRSYRYGKGPERVTKTIRRGARFRLERLAGQYVPARRDPGTEETDA
jgi:hypothetical protein